MAAATGSLPLAKGELEEALQKSLRESLASAPAPLASAIQYSLLAPSKRLRPRILLAAARMMSVGRDAALPAALALEMIHCSALIHGDLPGLRSAEDKRDAAREATEEQDEEQDEAPESRRGQPACHKKFGEAIAVLAGDSLLALATDVFLEAAEHAEPARFQSALRRLAVCAGPTGLAGGQAERLGLTSESTLDDLKRVNARRAASLFSAAILIPKDLAGIEDDSSQGLALGIFAQELGLAFQAMEDFRNAGGKEISPAHILYYLPPKEAKSMTLQRLGSATLSLSSAWGPPSQELVQIAEEITREIQASSEE